MNACPVSGKVTRAECGLSLEWPGGRRAGLVTAEAATTFALVFVELWTGAVGSFWALAVFLGIAIRF